MLTKEEIFRYINVGKINSISIDRRLMEKYPGIIQNVIIRQDAEVAKFEYAFKRVGIKTNIVRLN